MSIFRMDTCASGALMREDRAIGPYDYIRCGETSEEVGSSIGSAWLGAGASFDERSVFSWGPGFPVMSRRIARRVSSLIWVALGERLAVVGGNCLQEGEGPVYRRLVLDGLA